ncbi:MAG: molybdenum cofactor guanylyltransferase [Methanobacteriaceae archaeon]|jgi:molybdopterin-guanine dinucleotide biosynthesis protein A|nr:molybdenum cofactor guanylyltransferase [Candidatus Methanorudis spinitermitis]
MKNGNIRSAIVLCGGMSRRMGEDKGSMIINKKPMILHILETLNNQIDEAILVLNNSERIAKYKKIIKNYFRDDLKNELSYNLVLFEDEIKNHGPLSGIMTGLENISSNYALVLPCDSPFVNENFINFMFDSLDSKIATEGDNDKSKDNHLNDIDVNIDAIVPYHYKNKESNEYNNFNNKNNFFLNNEDESIKNFSLNNSEPLHSIYRKNNSKNIRKLLNSNIHDVKSLLRCLNSYFVLINDENTFKNINSKEDI